MARSAGGEAWLVLLEKAYAKMMGGYLDLEGGSPAAALRHLTGFPVDSYETASLSAFQLGHLLLDSF